ncbi:hypothetical protein FisN_19Lh008 [Fistulifera solaris]|uniref:Protein kinase domain-containing protein n=1 Tax=Fistulifera solaris TaxID=1519565 RepID=A0A1Z5JRP0_FISSO|nr:hypothetical protein FisN_19Lh008 [Fistulifera solaris]|eukprot:GAX16431.1 hypothetical protein FisN_19Lh008 [Fistulifera solaris]
MALTTIDACNDAQPSQTDRWKALTRASLQELFADSLFFRNYQTRREVPSLLFNDISTGNELGKGKYGRVKVITSFESAKESSKSFQRRQLFSLKGIQVAPDDELLDEKKDSRKEKQHEKSIQMLCKMHVRKNQFRYAIKVVNDDLDYETKTFSIVDLAKEACFLQQIKHPNIIRLRATVGELGTLSFGLVLDRLTSTLADEVLEWIKQYPECRQGRRIAVVNRLFVSRSRKQQLEAFYSHRLVVALDIARALRFLHKHNIVFRDLKPENLGISLRGHLILVDFGCAKELKEKELIEHPDGYKASAMAGTVRFMAPEVMKGLPYGLSSDVYSFSLMMWLLFSLEKPFKNVRFASMKDLCNLISEEGIRPQPLPILTGDMQNLIEDCWSANRADRPSIDHVCSILRAEIDATVNPSAKRHFIDRTKHILDISLHSLSLYSDCSSPDVMVPDLSPENKLKRLC